MYFLLERVEGDLTQDRVQTVLDLRGEHCASLPDVFRFFEQCLETNISLNAAAVSASVMGVGDNNEPLDAARYWCTPWPTSCASVTTSRARPG